MLKTLHFLLLVISWNNFSCAMEAEKAAAIDENVKMMIDMYAGINAKHKVFQVGSKEFNVTKDNDGNVIAEVYQFRNGRSCSKSTTWQAADGSRIVEKDYSVARHVSTIIKHPDNTWDVKNH